MDPAERELTLAWVRAWEEAGPALEAVKREELRHLTPEKALFFSDGLLSLPYPEDVRARRRAHSGLVAAVKEIIAPSDRNFGLETPFTRS